MRGRGIAVVVLATLAAGDAFAQPIGRSGPEQVRAVASVNGGWQAADRAFADSFTFERYVETAEVDVSYKVRSGPLYDGGLAVRLWRWLGAGVAASSFTDRRDASVTGSIPHPFFFDRPRALDGRTTARHREMSLHGFLAALVPLGRRLFLVVGGGPSVVSVEQTFVTAVDYDETYPYDEATFRRADMTTARARKVGAHAGVDVTLRLGSHLGAGATVRYTQVDLTLKPADGRTVTTRGGGVQAGAGLRLLF